MTPTIARMAGPRRWFSVARNWTSSSEGCDMCGRFTLRVGWHALRDEGRGERADRALLAIPRATLPKGVICADVLLCDLRQAWWPSSSGSSRRPLSLPASTSRRPSRWPAVRCVTGTGRLSSASWPASLGPGSQLGARSSIGNRMINARAESAGEKPAFARRCRRRRCLVVADGFYEWQKSGQAEATVSSFTSAGRRPFRICRAVGILGRPRPQRH